MAKISYETRAKSAHNPLLKKLFTIMVEKQTNLCIAADLRGIDNVIDLIHKVGKHICILKIHDSYFIKDNILACLKKLDQLKKQYNFLLFEDNKCTDNGEVTKVYYENYIDHVDMVTVCGVGSILGIEAAVKEAKLPADEPRGCLLICQKSYAETSSEEAETLLRVAEKNSICVGIIAQDLKLNSTQKMAMFKASPGVHLEQSTGGIDQKYKHPTEAIRNGADVIIVGSGIIKAGPDGWLTKTLQYKQAGWSEYLNSLDTTTDTQ